MIEDKRKLHECNMKLIGKIDDCTYMQMVKLNDRK